MRVYSCSATEVVFLEPSTLVANYHPVLLQNFVTPRVCCPNETGTAMDGYTKTITAVHEIRNGKHYQVCLYMYVMLYMPMS